MSNDSGGTALRPPSTSSIGTVMPGWTRACDRLGRLGHPRRSRGRQPPHLRRRVPAHRSTSPSSSTICSTVDARGRSPEDRTRPSCSDSRGPGPNGEPPVLDLDDEAARTGDRVGRGLLPGHRQVGGAARGVDAVDPHLRGLGREPRLEVFVRHPVETLDPVERIDDHEQPPIVTSLVEAMSRASNRARRTRAAGPRPCRRRRA